MKPTEVKYKRDLKMT